MGENLCKFLGSCIWNQLMTTWERFLTKCSGMFDELPEDKWLTLRSNIGIENKGHKGMKKNFFLTCMGFSFILNFHSFNSFYSILFHFFHSFFSFFFSNFFWGVMCSTTMIRSWRYYLLISWSWPSASKTMGKFNFCYWSHTVCSSPYKWTQSIEA